MKKLNKQMREMYNMDDRREYVKSKIDFVKTEDKRASKKPQFILKAATGFLIGSVLSTTLTIVIVNKNKDYTMNNRLSNYQKEANEYLCNNYDVYNKYPLSSLYLNDKCIVNIYKGINYDKEIKKEYYICQIYNLCEIENKISIVITNSQNSQREIIKDKNNNQLIDVINTDDFAIVDNYLKIATYYNDMFCGKFELTI